MYNSLTTEELMCQVWFVLAHHHMDRPDGSVQISKHLSQHKADKWQGAKTIHVLYSALHPEPGQSPILISAAGTSQEEAITRFEGAIITWIQKEREHRILKTREKNQEAEYEEGQ